MGAIATILLLHLTLTLAPSTAQSPPHSAVGFDGAVASVDRDATQIGIEVLRAGGNAVDAAIATAAALGVTDPFSAGIGGGGFMLIYLHDANRVIAIDGRETAPASASVDLFRDPENPDQNLPYFPNRISNGAAVGVPGTLATWTMALNRYGTLTLADALQPAIALAEAGFTVDETFVAQVEQNQERFRAFTSTHDLFLPDGGPPLVGSRFRNPDLAKTYRQVAELGENTFYRGAIGEAIVQTVQQPPIVENPPFTVIPGGMTMTDLDAYSAIARLPVQTTYRGYQLYGMGLPSSGGITTMQVLHLLEPLNMGSLERATALHYLIEAERLAFADRDAYLGDGAYVDAPVAGLLSKEYGRSRSNQLPEQAPASVAQFRATPGNPFAYQTDPSPSLTPLTDIPPGDDYEGLSTTHLTTADRFGNVVSYTLTIEATGGSGIVVPGYGFILNNELTDFDAVSPHPNAPEPGKRPRSSMAPTIARSPAGEVLAFGSPGGSTIITTVTGIAVGLMDFDLSLAEAIAAPRISQRNSGVTLVDSGFEQSSPGQLLSERGQVLVPVDEIGAATGIVLRPDGQMMAQAEPSRRGGGSAMVVRLTESEGWNAAQTVKAFSYVVGMLLDFLITL